MKRGHEMSVCLNVLTATGLGFFWLCIMLKFYYMPLELYAPLEIIDGFVALAAVCKLYNLWERW